MYEELEDRNNYMIALGNIGECYLQIARDTSGKISPSSLIPAGRKANLGRAIGYLRQCLELAKDLNNQAALQLRSKHLAEAEELSGNYAAALGHYKTFVSVKDSIFNIENSEKIAELETKRALDL